MNDEASETWDSSTTMVWFGSCLLYLEVIEGNGMLFRCMEFPLQKGGLSSADSTSEICFL